MSLRRGCVGLVGDVLKVADVLRSERERARGSLQQVCKVVIFSLLGSTSILPGDGNKRDPERENWPGRVMLPIQSISGSRLLP